MNIDLRAQTIERVREWLADGENIDYGSGPAMARHIGRGDVYVANLLHLVEQDTDETGKA